MNKVKLSMIVVFCLLVAACGTLNSLNTQNVLDTNIKGLQQVDAKVFASGQPSKEQLKMLRDSGITNIINLRPESETDWNQRDFVKSLGMKYHSIPIAGASDITNSNAQLLRMKLSELGDQSVLVHCSSANRVGSLISVDQYASKQESLETAIEEGKRWGLTSNEKIVREILNNIERQE